MDRMPLKNNQKRFFGSRLFLIILFVVAVLVALNYGRAYYQDYKIKEEIADLQSEVKKMEQKKIESLEILKYVTSKEFIEEKARTELNLKKPGEKVAIVNQVLGEKISSEKNNNNNVDISHLNNPMKWWYYFTRKSN